MNPTSSHYLILIRDVGVCGQRGTWSSRRRPTQSTTRDDPTAPRAATTPHPPVGAFVIANALHSQIAPFTAPPASNPVQIYVISVGSSSAGHSSCSIFNSQTGSFSSRMTFTLYCRLYKEKLMNLTPPFFLTGRWWGGGLITSVLIFPAAETERLHWFVIAFSPPCWVQRPFHAGIPSNGSVRAALSLPL